MRLLSLVAGLLLALGPKLLQAQEVWQADVRIRTLDITRIDANLVARVVVYSDNDDEARAVHVEILLPVGVGVVRTAPGCQASASPPGVSALRARVMCDLGTLPVRASREVFVMTTVPAAPSAKTFAVFALSETPDPRPGNNYAERTLPQ
ncbi:MAG TPA: hypothetical protein VGQ69_02450 [Gemmatimonadales bacterium]|nr:hypothetical protein [Gemmatimonadales bacterium]